MRRATNVFQTFLVSGVFSLLVLAFLLGFPDGAQADALTWQTLAPMPTARYGAATGAIGGKLYVAGWLLPVQQLSVSAFYRERSLRPSHEHMDYRNPDSSWCLRRCDGRHQRKALRSGRWG